jgi:hypothetical protein
MFTPGDRVARKGDKNYRGTVRRSATVAGKSAALVAWDNGSVTDVWQKNLVRSTDDGPEGLKAMFRF